MNNWFGTVVQEKKWKIKEKTFRKIMKVMRFISGVAQKENTNNNSNEFSWNGTGDLVIDISEYICLVYIKTNFSSVISLLFLIQINIFFDKMGNKFHFDLRPEIRTKINIHTEKMD